MGPPKLPNESNWGVLNLPPNKQHPAIHFGVPRYHVFRFLQLWRRLKTCPPTVQIPFHPGCLCLPDGYLESNPTRTLFVPQHVYWATCSCVCFLWHLQGGYGWILWLFPVVGQSLRILKHTLRRYIIAPKSYPKHFLRKHGWIHRE